jgi:hypothetical protein
VAAQIPGVSTPPSSNPGGAGVPTASIPLAPIDGVPKKASPLPLIVCTVLLLASLLIQLFQFQLGGGGWFFVGYFLTPVFTSLTLGWDAFLQRNGRKDPWFAPSPLFSRIIRIEVALSFVLGVFHILEIGQMCGASVIQSGALCA